MFIPLVLKLAEPTSSKFKLQALNFIAFMSLPKPQNSLCSWKAVGNGGNYIWRVDWDLGMFAFTSLKLDFKSFNHAIYRS